MSFFRGPLEEEATVFRRILYATDFSPASTRALEAALNLAEKFDAELRLLHVVDNSPMLSYYTVVYLAKRIDTARRKEARLSLEKLAGRKVGDRVRTRLEVRMGVPSKQIVASARKHRANLIVLGAHGYSGLERALLGSTAEKVIRTSSAPVLTVRGARPR